MCFNSIKVRLILFHRRTKIWYGNGFNSIKVRLIQCVFIMLSLCWISFNSIKVRLILKSMVELHAPIRFQFHKGSINTHVREVFDGLRRWFQFHKGSINTRCWRACQRLVPQFQFHKGSINTSGQPLTGARPALFQFHKGSINTHSSHHAPHRHGSFNSIKVRLILSYTKAYNFSYWVSIP